MILIEAIRIAKLAGTKIRELRETKAFSEILKDGDELVTTADLIANEMIKSQITKLFYDHKIFSEEDNIDGSHIKVSSPDVFDELKQLLL